MATIAFGVSDILCDDMSVVSASLFRVLCSSTQLNVVNWVLQRDGDWECACADFKPTQESQVTSVLIRASHRDHKSLLGLSRASSELNFMDKGKKSTDTKPPVEDEASRSGKDTGSVELSKASLEAIAEIVTSKLRVDTVGQGARKTWLT